MSLLHEGSHSATVHGETVRVRDVDVDLAVALPEGEVRAALVVVPDIMGLRPLYADLCRRLATHGIATAAFEPFARIPAAERATLELEARFGRVSALDDADIAAFAAAAADRVESAAGSRRAAVIGFCMGGYFTFKLAAGGRFRAAVPFYGMVRTPETWRGPKLADPLATAGSVCPTIAIFGGRDPYTPADDVAALRAAWAGRPDAEIVVYPDAEHGFVHDENRPAHRAADAADAWRRTLAFVG